MKRINQGITGHMLVKNEDQWVWYAIMSVLEFVDTLLITDTGSTDHTLEIIQTIHSPKIRLRHIQAGSADEITRLRQAHIDETDTPWLWIVDGDEIYPRKTVEEILRFTAGTDLEGVVVKRIDLLGDIYHFQDDETVGAYELFGKTGHYNLRLIRRSSGLTVQNPYPNEGYYRDGIELLSMDPAKFAFTGSGYFHTTYLKRSSLGGNLLDTHHRMKYKIERGAPVAPTLLPEVFGLDTPAVVPRPSKRSFGYELAAGLITPIKQMKRKLSK